MATAQFAHIGMNHLVQTTRVLCVMIPTTKTAKRYIDRAKERGQFIDATLGRHYRSILLHAWTSLPLDPPAGRRHDCRVLHQAADADETLCAESGTVPVQRHRR